MISKFKHIIWDWNGTLIDDAWLCLEIINGLLVKRSIPEININTYQEYFDFPVKRFYEKIGFDFSIEPFKVPADEYIKEYERRKTQCRLQQGVVEILSYLRNMGAGQSILSASKQEPLEEAVVHYSLNLFFNNIYGLSDHYANGKKDIGRNLLNNLGLLQNQVVIIGDTSHDFDVADSLGVSCILIANGHQNRRKLESCGVPVLSSINDLKLVTD